MSLQTFLKDKEITRENLHRWSYSPDLELNCWVARNPLTDPHDLALMASHMKASVRNSLWKHPSLPVEALRALAFGPWSDARVKRRVINHENVTPKLLRELASEMDESVLCEVAKKRMTPSDVLHTLATHASSEVRGYVASNSATAPETLSNLASVIDHASVQINVAENPNTSASILHDLALNTKDRNVFSVLLQQSPLSEEDRVMIILMLG